MRHPGIQQEAGQHRLAPNSIKFLRHFFKVSCSFGFVRQGLGLYQRRESEEWLGCPSTPVWHSQAMSA